LSAYSSPKVSVVILNFNTSALLAKFIPKLQASSYNNLEIVVADNHSSDDSVAMLKKDFPEIRLIELDQNYGFAGGYNKALEQLDSEYWVLLNSDVEVHPHWLQPLVDIMVSNEKIAAVGPKILDYFKRDYFEYAGAAGGYMDKWAYPFCRGRLFDTLEKDEGQYDDRKQVFWASGAAMLVRASVYKKLGGLDAELFAHMEEIDLCWRMKNAGFQVWICPDSKVYHMGGGTLSKQNRHKTFLNFRNNLAIIVKNAPRHKLIRYVFVRLCLDSLAALRYLFSNKWKHFFSIVHAHWDFLFFIRRWLKKRKLNQDPQIFAEHKGYYSKSIVIQYFMKGTRKVSELKF
jgi:GT2 family glycosyltransferase